MLLLCQVQQSKVEHFSPQTQLCRSIKQVKSTQEECKSSSWLNGLNPVYTIQPVVKPVYNRFEKTVVIQQPVVQLVWQLAVSCKQTSNRLSNRLNVCIHDTDSC